MTFLLIFIEFFKTGLFAVGGGLATIPFLMQMTEKYDWFTAEELSNMIAVSESTPGPIGVNMATYVGYTAGSEQFGVIGGILGGIFATTALVLPSLIIIMIIAGFLQKFRQNKLVEKTFFCLRPATIGMLAVSLISMISPLFFNPNGCGYFEFFKLEEIALFVLLLFGILKFKKHPIVYLGIGAIAGIIFKF